MLEEIVVELAVVAIVAAIRRALRTLSPDSLITLS